jgi:hypothetical protein
VNNALKTATHLAASPADDAILYVSHCLQTAL